MDENFLFVGAIKHGYQLQRSEQYFEASDAHFKRSKHLLVFFQFMGTKKSAKPFASRSVNLETKITGNVALKTERYSPRYK